MIMRLNIILSVVILVGMIALQVFLSNRENKWLGLILPGIWVVITTLASLFAVQDPEVPALAQALSMVLGLLLANIPSLILLAIYFACRRKFRRKNQLEKMNIQDL